MKVELKDQTTNQPKSTERVNSPSVRLVREKLHVPDSYLTLLRYEGTVPLSWYRPKPFSLYTNMSPSHYLNIVHCGIRPLPLYPFTCRMRNYV